MSDTSLVVLQLLRDEHGGRLRVHDPRWNRARTRPLRLGRRTGLRSALARSQTRRSGKIPIGFPSTTFNSPTICISILQ